MTALPYHSKQKGFSRLIGGAIGQGQLLSGGMSELLIANPNSSNWPLTPQPSAPGITQIRSLSQGKPSKHTFEKRETLETRLWQLFSFFLDKSHCLTIVERQMAFNSPLDPSGEPD